MVTTHSARQWGPRARHGAPSTPMISELATTAEVAVEGAPMLTEAALMRRLRPVALRKLQHLLKTAGELPEEGPGVLLPPFSPRFLADEVGCRPQHIATLLDQLRAEGILAWSDGQFRVPHPQALSHTPLL